MSPMRPLLVLALLAAPSAAFAGNPWEELMGPGKPRLWAEPQGRFYLDLPIGWEAKPRGNVVDFWKTHPDAGYVAHMAVEIRPVPPGVSLKHFGLRIEEETKKVAPQYQLIEQDQPMVGGAAAIRRYFTYQERNHAGLQNEVVQIIALFGERAFIITLETALGARGVFWEDFEKMIKGFGGRSPGEESLGLPQPGKKIKAGEMVNPNAVPY